MSHTRKRGVVVFITGISGVGKTTLAVGVSKYIEDILKKKVTILDGDEVRTWLSDGLGFSEDDRKKNMRRVGRVASEISRHGGVVICSLIAPYSKVREEIRKIIEQHSRYVEVYLHAPIDVLVSRDPKGLYSKSKIDKTIKMSGIDDIYEIPKTPDIDIDSSEVGIGEAVKIVLDKLTPILRNQ